MVVGRSSPAGARSAMSRNVAVSKEELQSEASGTGLKSFASACRSACRSRSRHCSMKASGVFGIPLPDLGIEFASMLHAYAPAGLAVVAVSCDVPDFQCH